VDEQRQAWLEGRLPLKKLDVGRWSVQEWRHFLDSMPAELTVEQVATLDARFQLTRSRNSFIARDWFRLAIAHDYRPAYPALEQYLVSNGRTRLISPLYRELVKTPAGREFATRVYEKARPGYHAITQAAINRIFKAPAKAAGS
jgi:hypothetical protein